MSKTLTDPGWARTTVLSGDPAAAVRELKARTPGEIQVHGSGQLVRWLAAEGLIDEMILLIYPVIVGQGTRLFPADGPDGALELLESRVTSGGVTFQVYRPTGTYRGTPRRYRTGRRDPACRTVSERHLAARPAASAEPLRPTARELELKGLLRSYASGPGALEPAREPNPRVRCVPFCGCRDRRGTKKASTAMTTQTTTMPTTIMKSSRTLR